MVYNNIDESHVRTVFRMQELYWRTGVVPDGGDREKTINYAFLEIVPPNQNEHNNHYACETSSGNLMMPEECVEEEIKHSKSKEKKPN